MITKYLPRSTEDVVRWYERYISPLGLIAGFLVDNFILLKRVDVPLTSVVFFMHFAIVGAASLFFTALEGGHITHPRLQKLAPFMPVAMQFSFGGLFSGFVALYSRSATYLGAWVFILLIVVITIGNERFMRFAHRISLRLTLLFTALFAFLAFYLPLIFHRIGTDLFVWAGVVALVLITLFAMLLARVAPASWSLYRFATLRGIAVVFVLLNVLYFTNLIPPLPLALRDAGVYHTVSRTSDGGYVLRGERAAWYEPFLPSGQAVHLVPGESVHVFTAVFAPTALQAPIFHVWQQYDSVAHTWNTVGTVSFTISGGREGGYRGYSAKYEPAPGRWRVNVETQEGRLIARVNFSVVAVAAPAPLVETQK